jgi:hypothetical protein
MRKNRKAKIIEGAGDGGTSSLIVPNAEARVSDRRSNTFRCITHSFPANKFGISCVTYKLSEP